MLLRRDDGMEIEIAEGSMIFCGCSKGPGVFQEWDELDQLKKDKLVEYKNKIDSLVQELIPVIL